MHKQKPVVLVGPMGAGKTTIGRRLAKHLNCDFFDSDHEIERRTGVEIAYIFDKEGESGFRDREVQAIEALTSLQNVVIATGGGAVMRPETRSNLAAKCFVIYLNTPVEQQLIRTAHSTHRPLLQSGNRREKLSNLLSERDPHYRAVADLIVNTNGKNAGFLCKEIIAHLEQL